MQRLLASGVLSAKKPPALLRLTEALDPLRLLTQREHFQKALWRPAITPSSEHPETLAPLPFSIQHWTEEKVPTDGFPHPPPSLLTRQRQKNSQKTGRPHAWRTRKDPFEGEWEQITAWLTAHPALTGGDRFHQVEHLSPGRSRPTQVRTLQRGLNKLRAHMLVTFDDQWGEDVINGQTPVPELHAELVAGVRCVERGSEPCMAMHSDPLSNPAHEGWAARFAVTRGQPPGPPLRSTAPQTP